MTPSPRTIDLPEEAPVHTEIGIETISDYKLFLDLETIWNEVAVRAGLDHPFLEYAWVRTWWESFGAGSSLHVLVLRSGERPIAIAPLIVTPVRMWGLKVRRLGFFYNAHVPRADFLIAERHEEVYRAIWTHLSANRCWDFMELCQLPEGSRTLWEIPKLTAQTRCRIGVWTSESSPYVACDSTWGAYFDGLATKHRSNLRNRFKRLKSTGPVEMEVITSSEKLAEGVEAGLKLEASAWKREAGTAISCDPAVSAFYSTLAGRAADRGWMCLHFLQAGSTRIAFDYSLSYKNRIHLLKLGYDPAYAPFSPSNLLLYLVLQDAFERGIGEYDLLGSDTDWKLAWARHVRKHYWLFVFSDTRKGQFLYLVKFRLVPLFKRSGLHHIRGFIQRAAVHLPRLGLRRAD